MKKTQISRRTFLQGLGGVAMSLPLLEIMAAPNKKIIPPKRMVCVGNWLGFVPDQFFPTTTGSNYQLSPLLKPLAALQSEFSIFSGLDHGDQAIGGHSGIHTFLSGILSSRAKHYPDGNITIDQVAAMHSGAQTRYPSMQFVVGKTNSNQLSWGRSGTSIPPVDKLKTIFNLLFSQTNSRSFDTAEKLQQDRISILDLVRTDAARLNKKASAADKIKIDEYFTSVRDLEKRLIQSKAWIRTPKPQVDYQLVNDADDLNFIDRVPLYYDLMALALETDSTRAITFEMSGIGKNSGGLNISRGEHQLSHHGKLEDYLRELHVIELFHTTQLSRFITKLHNTKQLNGDSLLDDTMVLFGSGFGNSSSHSNKKLPLLLAGGGFKHGQHLNFDKDPITGKSVPACNLFVSMLQRFGVETDQFNRSTSRLTGLEFS